MVFTPGAMELAAILLIFVLLFGANRLPKLARASGEALGEFKRGREEIEQELEEMQEPEDSPVTPVPEDEQAEREVEKQ